MANERTYLAWVRTGIAVMALGFVVAKFGIIIAVDDGSKSPDSILFLFFTKLLRAITCIKPPDITRIIPIDAVRVPFLNQ